MSDALTLAEARKQYNRAVEGPSQEKEESAFVVLLAAYLRDLAGTPDSETMERAARVMWDTMCACAGADDVPWNADIGEATRKEYRAMVEAAYPILVAPLRAEVERLKGATLLDLMPPGYELVSVAVREQLAIVSDDLATAEARVRELEDRLHLTRKLP